MKIKIGMEFRDFGFSNINFQNIESGNPGCGGTQYEFALLAHHLLKAGFECEIVFFHFNKNIFENGIKEVFVDQVDEIPERAKEENIDLLIFWATHDDTWYKKIDESGVNSIAWAHNFLSYKEIENIKKTKCIKKTVLVSKEQFELMCGEDIFENCCYISNMVDVPSSAFEREEALENNSVCIVGSIMKAKGFHILARQWKKISKKVRNPTLYVIGSGNLYNKNTKLGKYGIAEEKYEKRFIKYITEKDGSLLKSVVFLGNLGSEKEEYIKKTKVGVVNPTGVETFCISAVEFQAFGVPVCSKAKNGLLSTVLNKKTGLLGHSNYSLYKNITRLLNNNQKNIEMGKNAQEFASSFDGNKIIQLWIELIETNNVSNDKSINYFNRFKWLRRVVYYLRKKALFRWVPSPSKCDLLRHNIKSFLAKIKHLVIK